MFKKTIASIMAIIMALSVAAVPTVGLENLTAEASQSSDIYVVEGDYIYSINDDNTVTINRYTGSGTNVDIPSEIAGKTVTVIGDYYEIDEEENNLGVRVGAFDGCSTIVSVNIPDTVKELKSAFSECENLESISFGNSVEEIPFAVCFGLKKLQNVSFGNNVKTIGSQAFDNCPELKSIVVPESVTDIGDYAFGFKNGIGGEVTDGFALFCANDSAALSYAKSNNLFYHLMYKDFIYSINSDGTITIESYTGNDKNVTVPSDIGGKTVAAIGTYSGNNPSQTGNGGALGVAVGAFEENTTIKSVIIPDSVIKIESSAFADCSNLESAELGKGIKTIGSFAFFDCTKLTNVFLPMSITEIGVKAFGFNSGSEAANGLTITCPPSGVGEKYAKENNISYVLSKAESPDAAGTISVAANKTNSVTLSWNAVNNAEGYIIYRYDTANKKWIRLAKQTKTSYTVSNLEAGTSYWFAVKTYITADGKEIGAKTLSKVFTSTSPVLVSKVTASANTDSSVKLSWTKTSRATDYVVYRYNTSTVKWVRLGKTKNTSFTVTNLPSGTSYWFAVKSVRTLSNGNEVGATKLTKVFTSTCPAKTEFTVKSVKKGTAAFSWKKVSGATGYIVYYKKSTSDTWHRLKVTSGTSFTATNLKSKNYIFTVKAYKVTGGNTYNGKFIAKTVRVK